MLKKTIAFTDVDGNAASETHYFNLTTADLVKMQLREGEGFQDYLTRIVESGDGQAIIDTFEKILRLSYGIRTAEGKFVKPAGAFDEFMASEAYSELFMEICTNAKKSAEFISAIMPNDLAVKVEQMQSELGISQNLQAHLELPDEPAKMMETGRPGKKQPRSKAELLAAYKEKNDAKVKPPYAGMTIEEAMELPAEEFGVWLQYNT
jgi:hypothetical protein